MANRSKDQGFPLHSFSKVVEAIYHCVLDPDHWHEALRGIAEISSSQRCSIGAHVFASETSKPLIVLRHPHEGFVGLDKAEHKDRNPCFGGLQLLPVGGVATRAMLIDDRHFEASRFHQECCQPLGLGDAMFLKVHQTGLRFGLLVASRLETQPRYDVSEVRLLTFLAPHVCRTVAISRELNSKAVHLEGLEATVDGLDSALYLTDRTGCIVFMNQAAKKQAKTSDALHIEHNRLTPVDRQARVAVSRALAEVTVDAAATATNRISVCIPDREAGSLVATIFALNRSEHTNVDGSVAATAAIVVQDPIIVPPLPAEDFAELYHLTDAELRVLLAMSRGLSVKEAGKVLGINETTVKTHVQHIHAKTGTHKQTELMHLLISVGCRLCSCLSNQPPPRLH